MSTAGHPLITDFGISTLLNSSSSRSSGLNGSARWMAPEVLRAEGKLEETSENDHDIYRRQLADVWALGMTVYVGSYRFLL